MAVYIRAFEDLCIHALQVKHGYRTSLNIESKSADKNKCMASDFYLLSFKSVAICKIDLEGANLN